MRTQKEIARRFVATRANDLFGWRAEVLLPALDFDHLPTEYAVEVDRTDWPSPLIEDAVRENARGYLTFAFGKAVSHRGISAERSVTKMREYLWLLELPLEGFDAADYSYYGVPCLVIAAGLLGVPVPTDDATIAMSLGRPCRSDCPSCNYHEETGTGVRALTIEVGP